MAYAAKPLVEAELAVGRWRATDCVVLLARAATHRKASGGPLPSPCAHSPRARCFRRIPPRVSFHRYPFHGIIFTLSRYSEKRMAAPSFPLFSHPTTHMALCDSHSLAPITGILSQWVPTPFDFIDNLFRRVFRPLCRLGRRFAVPALVTRSTSKSDSPTLSRLFVSRSWARGH